MLVRAIMAHPVTTVNRDADLRTAARLMVDGNIGCLPVVDDGGALVGILTESDFQAHQGFAPFSLFEMPKLFGRYIDTDGIERIYREAGGLPIHRLMQRNPRTLPPDATVEMAAALMLRHGIHHVPIVDGGKPVGMVARRELLRLLAGHDAAG